jgi:N6-adenosine-specific RNA methylase IME4
MSELSFHPYANLFPLMEGDAYDELVDDIRVNGQREDIVTLDGMILDGRNRYRACRAADVVPRFRQFDCDSGDGVDALEFVISKNLRRRDLDESQRAMVAADMGRMHQGARTDLSPLGEKSQGDRAKVVGVGKRSVERAEVVVDHGVAELAGTVRAGRLAVSVAAEVAKLPETEQRRIVSDGVVLELPRRARAALSKHRRDERLAHISSKAAGFPDGKFAVIYCDIPRRFNVRSRETGLERSPDNHYPTMTFDELIALSVADLAAPDCVLFFWSTAASLLDDIEIMTEWGFVALRSRDESGRLKRDAAGRALLPVGAGSYRSHQVWAKDRAGTGYWFRSKHELLLVGVRGNVPAPLPGTQDDSLINAPVGAHSQKPDCFRNMIGRHYAGLPMIELFCRGAPGPGWQAFGNQALTATAGAAPTEAVRTPPNPDAEPFEVPTFPR